jgi:hypothetical protein
LAVKDVSSPTGNDTSIHIVEADPGVALTSWDVITVPATPGKHRVVLGADSFGMHTLQIPVVDHIDRIDTRLWQDATRVGDTAIVCFHAYTDDIEVAIDMTVTVDGIGENNGGAGRNCIYARATRAGTMTVNARAGELEASMTFTVP